MKTLSDKEMADLIGWRRLQAIRNGETLSSAKRNAARVMHFCQRSGVAAVNIGRALDDFLAKDKEIKERYENNKKESHTPVQRSGVEAHHDTR